MKNPNERERERERFSKRKLGIHARTYIPRPRVIFFSLLRVPPVLFSNLDVNVVRNSEREGTTRDTRTKMCIHIYARKASKKGARRKGSEMEKSMAKSSKMPLPSALAQANINRIFLRAFESAITFIRGP